MLLKDEVDLLRKVPLFAHLDPAKLKLLAFTSTRASFKPGQELFHQGDEGDAAYLILSGEAVVVADAPSGEVPVATVGQNAIIGEIAILCEVPRTATVRAASRSRRSRSRRSISCASSASSRT
jgi:CRP/FNR family transcriptional regulator, cyclic AMP receptor protein